jgi:hypothetical protein
MRRSLFMICQQWVAVTISHLFSVTVSEQCGTSWCGILQSNVCFCTTPMCNTDLLETVGKNFNINFMMKKVPSRQTIHNLVKKLLIASLLVDRKLKHKQDIHNKGSLTQQYFWRNNKIDTNVSTLLFLFVAHATCLNPYCWVIIGRVKNTNISCLNCVIISIWIHIMFLLVFCTILELTVKQ